MAGAYHPEDMIEGQWVESRWRLSMRRLLPLLLGLLLAGALGALLYSASNAQADHERALDEQRKSFEVIALVRQFEGTTARAEATLARYVISLDPDTGRLFQWQWRLAAGQLKSLAFATRKSDWQRRNVEALQTVFNERGKRLNDIGLRTTYDQKMGALAQFHKAGTSADLTQMTSLIGRITDAETQRLRERSVAVTLAGDRTAQAGKTSQLMGLVLLVCILFGAWIIHIMLTDRRNARLTAEAEAERADRLEAAVAARTAELRDANARLEEEAAERAAAQDSLRQMQKMEAVGQLTGGIAHDFNNMLAVVVGGLELAKRKLRLAPKDAAIHLDNAMDGANRASALTRRLLAFARSEPLLPAAVDPDALIKGMSDLIDRTIGDQIIVTIREQAGGWRIFVDRHQMENAILNLCVNARDAMEGRGTLSIETDRAALKAGEVGECAAGDYVRLTVTDNGVGMAPDVLERVFEPFFTTKPVGKGTGLGLSQIFGLVRQSQGEIRIESAIGKGTSVHLYLPRRTGADAGADTQAAAGGDGETRQPPTRILVVEDDPRVLNQTMAALAELGHLPIACDHPAKAATLLQSHGDIGLIVSDVLMPGMTGPEMVQALPTRWRHVPVLFVTGYAGDVGDGAQFGGHHVLRKPYTLAGLAQALTIALSGSNHPGSVQAAE